ncbi:hypothetical protein IWW45_009036 [Coemansia sp. RSA 485]|nr:hypothetical protein IWW45_009036 [Coemansia sp. RSA 485]
MATDSHDEHNASDSRLGSDGLEYDCDDDFDLDFDLDPDPGTPQESDSEDCLSEASESAIPSGAVSVPEENAMIDTTIPPAAAAAASTRTTTDYGPPSRSTTVSSKHRTSVYIQPSVDLESAARYGEGYRHMNIDRHDDGSLVVASPEESQSDGFIPALIAATRRKREIQIIRFQHAIDAPDDAIGGTKTSAVSAADALPTSSAAAAAIAATSTAAARGIGSGESISTGNPQAPESSFMASIRDKLETQQQKGKECANSSSDDDNESADIVLDMAVNAMMESLSSSQSVMQIRCPQCPETAPTISSLDWDTHRDWHMARQLQERELRHETLAQKKMTTIYVDGSCIHDGLPNASAGVGVYFGPNDPRNLSGKVHGNIQSSARAEIDAVRRALAIAIANANYYPVVGTLTIETDSQYAIDALTIPQHASDKDIPHLDIINDFKRQLLASDIPVNLAKVKDHGDSPGNKAAHELAKRGAQS